VAVWFKAWVCGLSLGGFAVRIPPVACISVSLTLVCLCVELITCPEQFYWVWCVWVWSWSLEIEEAVSHWGLFSPGGRVQYFNLNLVVSVPLCVYTIYWNLLEYFNLMCVVTQFRSWHTAQFLVTSGTYSLCLQIILNFFSRPIFTTSISTNVQSDVLSRVDFS
jgi:hypothetical protein